ncbi:paraquat-inducible protein A [Suttonella sp. R2A3]|uniref:paraquat-inducible protein A n=1 Tax=Suttonella sp. R2A3 TaxID=2908648 RepID=UPI001F3CFBFF|nr:paraquat-inducible protein A [Suttonella sp. R2A3]UJF25367.1 paraquat-inducible protein A [Suttonella sp. R2A3]
MTEHDELIACPYCDSLYQRTPLASGQKLTCTTCHSTIDRGLADFRKAFIFALSAILLFILAHSSPFITITLGGDSNTISILSAIGTLFENRLPILAVIVFFLIIVTPLWYLLGVLWVVISFRYRLFPRLSRHFLHWMVNLSPWNMLEVYLVAVVVTLVKIMQIAEVEFNAGFWAFCGLMIASIMTTAYFHLSDEVFKAYDPSP